MPLFGRASPPSADPLLSTGHPALDAAVGGGLAPASVTLVRPQGSVSVADFRSEQLLLVLGAVAAGRGALVMMAPGEDPAALWSTFDRGRRGLDFDARVRLADLGADHLPVGPWHVPMHPQIAARIAVPRMTQAERAVRGPANEGSLEISNTDALERTFGPAAAERVVSVGLERLPASRNWVVYWGLREGRARARAEQRARLDLVLLRDRAGLSMAGRRPSFPPIFLAP